MSLGETLLVLLLYVLVAARVTRLINYDTLLDPIRLWIARRASSALIYARTSELPEEKTSGLRRHQRWTKLSEFLGCPWCVGFWVAAALSPIPVVVIGWPWWTCAVLPFACSHLIGIGDRWVADPLQIVADE